ncbi:hypothetical protein EOD42_23425 [Rhodovarius crocodyli]|uniref:Acyltransferase n=1 Tax=Rhodovarius crocodyli TaxID=1979269 RepID=A0A437LZ22_9PROT|nr:hypothetical protein [Rhodovarius crocodyli]RVT90586.1 hypothetical protein EOD42_23425 [Rhodovarius crocodyli]
MSETSPLMKNLHPLIGSRGFETPDLSGLKKVVINSEKSLQDAKALGVDIIVPANIDYKSGKIFLILYVDGASRRRLTVNLSSASEMNAIFLCGEHGLNGKISLSGRHNRLIDLGNTRGHKSNISCSFWGTGGVLYWGKEATSNGFFTEFRREKDTIIVGEDCMFASEIVLRPTDMHAAFSMQTGEIMNHVPGKSYPIVIHPHVWVGQRVTVLKNVTVGPGSILGAGSIITSNVPHSSMAGGNPGKVLRRDISWTRSADPSAKEIGETKSMVEEHVALFEAQG